MEFGSYYPDPVFIDVCQMTAVMLQLSENREGVKPVTVVRMHYNILVEGGDKVRVCEVVKCEVRCEVSMRGAR